MDVIKIVSLTKYFGNKKAIDDVTITIEQGMFGLIGENGAGKTTFMKILATLLKADSGSINICGVSINNDKQIRDIIGYLPQDFSMYGDMTVYEAMDYLGVLSGLKKRERHDRIIKTLKTLNLIRNRNDKVKQISGGMKRRLGVAQAILNEPKVLILDEPTVGLDPEEKINLRNLLSEIAKERIVILSTHIIEDIEATCEKIAIMKEGRMLYSGRVSEVLKMASNNIYCDIVSDDKLKNIKDNCCVISMKRINEMTKVRFAVKDNNSNYLFKGEKQCSPTVEDAYMYIMNKSGGVK